MLRCLSQAELTLTDYDVGRREQRRATDKMQRYITDSRVPKSELSFSVNWTWTGALTMLAGIAALVVTCCVGELSNDEKDHYH